MSVTFFPKKSPLVKKNESWFQSFLSVQREREMPMILAIQARRNTFLDWYFFLASVLGEEIFFITFIPSCSWFLSRQIAVHQTFLLALAVGGGNMIKNYFQSSRPPSKSVWINSKNPQLDPGFPSTHTMTAFTIPWCLLFFYWEILSLPALVFLITILLWWSLSISISRIYNGHHYIIDVLGGFLLSLLILSFWSRYARFFIDTIITDRSIFAPLLFISVALFLLYMHPQTPTPTPVIAESALVFGTCCGTVLSVWLHHFAQLSPGLGYNLANLMLLSPTSPVLYVGARFLIGIICVGVIRELSKKIFLPLLLYCHTAYVDHHNVADTSQPIKKTLDKTNYKYTGVDVALKYITYTLVSFTATTSPHIMCMLGLFHVSDLVVFS